MDIMMLTLLTVHLVLLNVVLVKEMLITVLPVVKEELTHQLDVLVKKENTSILLLIIVKFVTMLAQPVLLIMSVLIVLMKPELTILFVIVWITTMIMVSLNVHLVLNNVTSVKTVQSIVLYVLKEELTHQNVLFHHQKLKLLKLKIFQSDLLKSFYVNVTV